MVVPNVPGDWPSIAFQRDDDEKTGIPIFPINDVRAITLGEFTFGAGQGWTRWPVMPWARGLVEASW